MEPTIDTELQQLQLHENGGIRIIDMSGTLLDQSYIVQMWLLTHCIFVWMGPATDKPCLGSLSTAITTRYSPMPLITSILGAPEMEEQQIAQKLTRRTGRQCFVSCQLPDHIPELVAYVENQITKRLIDEGIIIIKFEKMLSTAPMDDAIHTLSKELANDKSVSHIGKTEAEKELLAQYANIGRRRGVLGFTFGSSIMAGLWILSKNRKKVVGAFAMISGGFFGASYGIISIRRDLFSDLLILPSDKSPFAARARTILQTKIPDNPFVQELHDRFKRSAAAVDSWDEGSTVAEGSDFQSASLSRHNNIENSTSIPPISGLDTLRNKKNKYDEDLETFKEDDHMKSRSPFFFGMKSDKAEDYDLSMSHDPNMPYSRNTHHPYSDKNSSTLRHDEDDYFFGLPNEKDTPVKSTTWDEIRRRAAKQDK
ncbi:putative proteasome assembly chaperone 4 [Plasmopara halstedii]